MELNWSTFILEIINFLVLVWLLKRFLYKPVLAILQTRKETVEGVLANATSLHAEAVDLEQKYQGRLDEWALEKQQARETLQQEIQNEKSQQLEKMQKEIASEREKAAVIEQRRQNEIFRQYQQKAHAQGAKFAAKLLTDLAGPEVNNHLFELLISEFSNLKDERKATLKNACVAASSHITVASAYPMSESQSQQLEQILSSLCEQKVIIDYQHIPELLGGFRITIGAWVLCMNLQDELSGFMELSYENADF